MQSFNCWATNFKSVHLQQSKGTQRQGTQKACKAQTFNILFDLSKAPQSPQNHREFVSNTEAYTHNRHAFVANFSEVVFKIIIWVLSEGACHFLLKIWSPLVYMTITAH
jgi:hypothetical protein